MPKTNSDPDYHYQGILAAMKTAASKMPRVDGIGVSSAGEPACDFIKANSGVGDHSAVVFMYASFGGCSTRSWADPVLLSVTGPLLSCQLRR